MVYLPQRQSQAAPTGGFGATVTPTGDVAGPGELYGMTPAGSNWQIGVSPGKRTNAMTGAKAGLSNDIMAMGRYYLNAPHEVYGGPGVPEANALQRQAFEGASNMQNLGINPTQAIQGQLQAGADPAAVQQYYREAVELPSMQGFRDTMDMVGQRYGDRHGTSGGMLRQMGGAVNDYRTNLSGQLAGLQYQERADAFDRNNQGIGNAQNYMASNAKNLQDQLNIGGQQRAIQAQMNQEGAANWEAQQAYNNPWLQSFIPMALGINDYAQKAPKPSTLEQVAGGLGGLGSLVGGIGSLFG